MGRSEGKKPSRCEEEAAGPVAVRRETTARNVEALGNAEGTRELGSTQERRGHSGTRRPRGTTQGGLRPI